MKTRESGSNNSREEKAEEPSRTDLLVALVTAKAVLFHDEKGDGFARVFDSAGRPDTHRLTSSSFQHWLDFEVWSCPGFVDTNGGPR